MQGRRWGAHPFTRKIPATRTETGKLPPTPMKLSLPRPRAYLCLVTRETILLTKYSKHGTILVVCTQNFGACPLHLLLYLACCSALGPLAVLLSSISLGNTSRCNSLRIYPSLQMHRAQDIDSLQTDRRNIYHFSLYTALPTVLLSPFQSFPFLPFTRDRPPTATWTCLVAVQTLLWNSLLYITCSMHGLCHLSYAPRKCISFFRVQAFPCS